MEQLRLEKQTALETKKALEDQMISAVQKLEGMEQVGTPAVSLSLSPSLPHSLP
jgi:hypothetical protein